METDDKDFYSQESERVKQLSMMLKEGKMVRRKYI